MVIQLKPIEQYFAVVLQVYYAVLSRSNFFQAVHEIPIRSVPI